MSRVDEQQAVYRVRWIGRNGYRYTVTATGFVNANELANILEKSRGVRGVETRALDSKKQEITQ